VKGYGFLYFTAEAFRGLRANRLVNLLAISTICMAMVIAGFFLLTYFNLQDIVHAMGDRLEMSVYLNDGVVERDRDLLLNRVKAEPGVKKATYLPKARALELFRKELKGQETLIDGLGDNPLPDSFEVTIDSAYADRMEILSRKFSGYHGVEEVSYGRQGAETITGLLKLITYGGTVLAALIGLSVIFIISNSVRLALYSRGQEIELMQWIGATRGFILGPFLIEGMLLAMIGAALAMGVLAGMYYALPQDVVRFLSRPNGLDFLPMSVVAYMIVGGGLLGLTGGLISANRFLE